MKVLITDYDFPDLTLERMLYAAAGIEMIAAQCRTEDEVIEASQGCAGLLVQYAPVNGKVFAARPEIRIASRYGAGYDTIDTDAARTHGVWVANSPDYGVGEVATHALAMTLSLLRHIVFYDRDVKAGTWHFTSAGPVKRASDLTLGILGLGRIGKRMAHISRDCFHEVIACDPYLIDGDFPAYVRRVDLDTLFSTSDVISLHLPLNAQTRGIVDGRQLAKMQPGSVLTNTARGPLVDVHALLDALDTGILHAAALDVLPTEPPDVGSRIVQHPRVVLSPHAAFYSETAEKELRRKAAQNLVDWSLTGRPSYVVVEGTNQQSERSILQT